MVSSYVADVMCLVGCEHFCGLVAAPLSNVRPGGTLVPGGAHHRVYCLAARIVFRASQLPADRRADHCAYGVPVVAFCTVPEIRVGGDSCGVAGKRLVAP